MAETSVRRQVNDIMAPETDTTARELVITFSHQKKFVLKQPLPPRDMTISPSSMLTGSLKLIGQASADN